MQICWILITISSIKCLSHFHHRFLEIQDSEIQHIYPQQSKRLHKHHLMDPIKMNIFENFFDGNFKKDQINCVASWCQWIVTHHLSFFDHLDYVISLIFHWKWSKSPLFFEWIFEEIWEIKNQKVCRNPQNIINNTNHMGNLLNPHHHLLHQIFDCSIDASLWHKKEACAVLIVIIVGLLVF